MSFDDPYAGAGFRDYRLSDSDILKIKDMIKAWDEMQARKRNDFTREEINELLKKQIAQEET